jgi:2-iminobutanoate/2-iminopropanoate deaminase
MLERTAIHPEGMSTPFGVWTTAVAVSGATKTIYISGLTARDTQGQVVGVGDIAAQTRQVCANLEKTMKAAGGSLADIVSVTVYATDVTQFDAIHKERRAWFPSMPPASAMVEVSRLVDERCLIEISAIAAL